ncbi:helix-turn-helix DNA-binding domain protein [Gordonia phage ODay]|nr:helix-turn-helix DNA-binding domain protein [Gordonia phage ODay]
MTADDQLDLFDDPNPPHVPTGNCRCLVFEFFEYTRCAACGFAIGNIIGPDHPARPAGLVAEWIHIDSANDGHYPIEPCFFVRMPGVLTRYDELWKIRRRQKEWIQ